MADIKGDPKAVLDFAKKNNVQILDIRFTDIPGLQHHVSYSIGQLTEAVFEEGFGMDGSSIRGWAAIHESDMLLIPDATTYRLDPFTEIPTLMMIADVQDPVTKQRYDRDPRYIAKKSEMYLNSTGIADTIYFGPELEFFIFDSVRFDQRENLGFISSTPKKDAGTPAARKTTWAIVRATRKAISRCLPRITTRICVPKWC